MLVVMGFFLDYLLVYYTNVLFAKLLIPKQYGLLIAGLKGIFILVPLMLLGLESTLLKYLPIYAQQKDISKMSGLIKWVKTILHINCGIVLAICIVSLISIFISHLLGWQNAFLNTPLWFMLWFAPLFTYVAFQSFLLLCVEYRVFPAFTTMIACVIIIALLQVYHFVFGQVPLLGIILIIAFAALFLIFLQNILIGKSSLKTLDVRHASFHSPAWWKTSKHMLLFGVLAMVCNSINIILLQWLVRDKNEVGFFAAILTVSALLLVFSQASNLILSPLVSSQVESGDLKTLQGMVNLLNTAKIILGTVVLILFICFAKVFLMHFGARYAHYSHAFIYACIAYYLKMFYSSGKLLLIYSGHVPTANRLNIVELSVLVLLCVLWIPNIGILGLSLAMLVCYVLMTILTCVFTYKRVKIKLLTWI